MKTPLSLLFAALSAAGAARAEAPVAGGAVLLTGADLVTVSHGTIKGGELLIRDGKIAALGAKVDAPADAQRIDLAGKRVYPGYIAANSVLGLTEIEAVRASNDMAEVGPINPNARAQVAINPDSELLPVARANGVLTVNVVPQPDNGGVITGQSALLKLDGWTYEDMTLATPSGVHLYWPEARLPSWLPEDYRKRAREAAEKKLQALDQAMRDARAYQAARRAGTVKTEDLRWEAMLPVLDGKEALFVHADGAADIRDALAFVEREKLARVVLVGGQDAWRLADELAARRIPVILGTSQRLPLRRWEAYDTAYTDAVRLAQAGVTVAIANRGESQASSNERNLPYQAAGYAAYGLGEDAALRAITLTPAEILGVADRLGSLDVGKDATLFVADGDALDARTRVERAWIQGHEVDLSNHQTRLYEKYKSKYEGKPRP
ncbi:amidohydrolase [Mizugakiibacter sediminis]|uniref:Amidohydrolase n=1 Tax=Mizugakiibacter sediminis TaxID=1475481 RepID=A0A0K8QME0_9GAMM|nr:amidohydrolase family protein [Mizugakiibacter sediminis]GAP66070.1 amidohydrolase [Mizugakiibacter sediminis]